MRARRGKKRIKRRGKKQDESIIHVSIYTHTQIHARPSAIVLECVLLYRTISWVRRCIFSFVDVAFSRGAALHANRLALQFIQPLVRTLADEKFRKCAVCEVQPGSKSQYGCGKISSQQQPPPRRAQGGALHPISRFISAPLECIMQPII